MTNMLDCDLEVSKFALFIFQIDRKLKAKEVITWGIVPQSNVFRCIEIIKLNGES